MIFRSGSARVDLFVVADAVLISLACMLVIFAYREISATPARNAQLLAEAIGGVAMVGDVGAAGRPETRAELQRRIEQPVLRAQEAGITIQTAFYSEIPGLSENGESFSDFLKGAWDYYQSGGGSAPISAAGTVNGAQVHRTIYPVFAAGDCSDCVSGTASFRNGDLVGVREFRVPRSSAFTQTIRQLLYAIAILATALMCVLGIIFPVLRRSREDGVRMQSLTSDLEREVKTDPLTRLYNRRHFDKALQAYFAEFNKINSPVSLLLFDIDHFKQINDSYGHDVGDTVLKEIADKLRHITRNHDVAARIGGDEFAVITPYLSDRDLLSVAERYRREVNDLRILVGSAVLRPTISVGVATGGTEPAALFKAADDRLYDAKNSGRNRIAA